MDDKPVVQDTIEWTLPWHRRLTGMFFEPSNVFRSLDQKSDWIWPLIIIITAIALSTAAGIIMKFRSPEFTELIAKASLKDKSITYWGPVIGGIFVVVMGLMGIFIKGGIIHVVAPFMNGKAEFKKLIGVLGYSSMPYLVLGVLSLIYALLNPNDYQTFSSSLDLFWTKEQAGPVLYEFLGCFDLFAFWTMVLTIGGLATIYKFGWKKAAIIVILFWIIMTGLATGMKAATHNMFDQDKSSDTKTETTADE